MGTTILTPFSMGARRVAGVGGSTISLTLKSFRDKLDDCGVIADARGRLLWGVDVGVRFAFGGGVLYPNASPPDLDK